MGNLPGQIAEQVAEAPADATPQVFVRTFTTPAGMPWEQGRAASLEARHGAPLPLSDLVHRIRRLASWSPGAVGRYAVFYVRRRDYRGPFETTVDVDGQAIRVAFGSGARPDLTRARNIGFGVVMAAAAIVVLGVAVSMALAARSDAEARLAGLEQQVASRARLAKRLQAERDRSRGLAVARGEAGLPTDVLNDLGWLARSRVADARIVAVHWDRGLMAVESRSAAAPVQTTDRQIVRSERPLRSGVWLWGISPTPQGAAPRFGRPVAAEPRS